MDWIGTVSWKKDQNYKITLYQIPYEIDVTFLVAVNRLTALYNTGIGCGVPWTHSTYKQHSAKHKLRLT